MLSKPARFRHPHLGAGGGFGSESWERRSPPPSDPCSPAIAISHQAIHKSQGSCWAMEVPIPRPPAQTPREPSTTPPANRGPRAHRESRTQMPFGKKRGSTHSEVKQCSSFLVQPKSCSSLKLRNVSEDLCKRVELKFKA